MAYVGLLGGLGKSYRDFKPRQGEPSQTSKDYQGPLDAIIKGPVGGLLGPITSYGGAQAPLSSLYWNIAQEEPAPPVRRHHRESLFNQPARHSSPHGIGGLFAKDHVSSID